MFGSYHVNWESGYCLNTFNSDVIARGITHKSEVDTLKLSESSIFGASGLLV